MSDHEDGGADEWEEGTLPGTPTIGTTYSQSESLLKPSTHIPRYQRQPIYDRSNARFPAGPRNGGLGREENYSRRSPITGIPGRDGGVSSRQARPSLPSENAAKQAFDARENPTTSYVLSVTWDRMLKNVPPSDDMPPPRMARMHLDEIAERTETYILTPDNQSTDVHIWGTAEQAKRACENLRIWEGNIRETGLRPHRGKWIKQTAVDGRDQERKARQATHALITSQWRASDDYLDHSYELCLLWPKSIGIEDFQIEHVKTIEDLEIAYNCRVLCNNLHSMVQVFAHDEVKLIQVQERLINIGREMIAKRNEVIRANLLRYPKSTIYRSNVRLTKASNSDLFLPSLCGDLMPQSEIEQYQKFSKRCNHHNRIKVRRLIEKGLSGHLQLSSQHVRMRVNFLELAFQQYKKPRDGRIDHDFSDYAEMVGDERTLITGQGLRSNGRDMRQLADKLIERLGHPKPVYSIYFDFGNNSSRPGFTLRFECDMQPSVMPGEMETVGQRWLEHRSDAEDDRLLINVLDFERISYQIVIRAVPFPNNQAIKSEMDVFTRSVEYTPSPEGIKAPPKRRAKFPPGRQTLRKVAEMTILRYNYKDLGTFELRRRDTYLVNSESKEISTDWSATYYYLDWDNMMGKFGDLKPGQDVDFDRSVTSFFPVQNHERAEAGLKRFTNEIEELQSMLAECINELPEETAATAEVISPPTSPVVDGYTQQINLDQHDINFDGGNDIGLVHANDGPPNSNGKAMGTGYGRGASSWYRS